jgi:hypothetical protein
MWENEQRLKNLIPQDHPQLELILELEEALRKSWRRELCNAKDAQVWSSDNPAFGMCAITALVVDDYLAGQIVKDDNNDHYWNGSQGIDLTREQFPADRVLAVTRVRPRNELLEGERAVAAGTPQRYLLLKGLVEENLRRRSSSS